MSPVTIVQEVDGGLATFDTHEDEGVLEVETEEHPNPPFFFLLYAAWVRSRAERPSVSYTKVVMEVAWTGHNLQFTKTN